MADKNLNIGIKVDSTQLDQTAKKVGELKQLSNKISIQYDIDGKPLDVVINKSLNLQQQVKALTAELRRTKEGTQEFALLSSRLGQAQDELSKTTAKSKDLFTSLSMIPGPVGQFFSQLQGGIELLKTFSSFTFKDLQFQFKETADDIADIGKNLSQIDTEGVDEITESNNDLAQSFGEVAAESNASTTAISNNTKAIQQLATTSGQYNEVIKQGGRLMINSKIAIKDMTDAQVEAGMAERESMMTALKANKVDLLKIEASKEFQKLKEGEVVRINLATGALEQSVVATKAANFWTTTLGTTIKTVLISTGILAAIVVLGELVAMLYRYVMGTEESEKATRSFTAALEAQQRAIDLDIQALDAAGKAAVTRAKIAGKSEEDIYKVTKQFAQEKLKELQNYDKELMASQDRLKNDTKIKGEEREKLTKDINDKLLKNNVDISNQIIAIQQLGLDEELRIKEKQRAASKKQSEDNKKNLEDIAKNEKDANKTLKDLRNENILSSMQDERHKQRSELEFQRQSEEDKIDELKISEELKGKIKEQIQTKFDLKQKALAKKFNDEDEKLAYDFSNKLADISISAIQKQVDRDIAAREEKFSRDLRDLEKDKEFIKMSEDTKGFYRSELIKAKEEDIRKIKIDAAIKTYQDELLLLTAQQKNLLEGTDAYYQNQLKVEENAYQTKLLNAQKNNDDITQIEKEHEENLKNIRLQGFIAEKNLAIQRAGVIKGIGDSLQQLAGKNKDVAIAGILVTKAAGVAEIIMNTQIANAKALATLGPIAGPIWVAVNSVAAGLSIAATVKSAIDGINQIKQQGQGTGGGGGGAAAAAVPNYGRNYEKGGMIGGRRHAEGGTIIEAEKGEAIMTRGAVTMFRPLLSLMNQAGGGVSFNSNLTTTGFDNPKVSTPAEDNKPMIVKTYVVSSELTNEQHRQARLKDLSTL